MIPEQDGYGSLQVGTQSGETCEHSWSVAVQVGSVYVKIEYITTYSIRFICSSIHSIIYVCVCTKKEYNI